MWCGCNVVRLVWVVWVVWCHVCITEFDVCAPVGSARAKLAFGHDLRFSSLRSPSPHGSGGQVRTA